MKRTLALGNLLPRIRTLYRRDEIDAATVRHLTLATKGQQQEWLALLDTPDSYCPMGHALKAWVLGGTSIPVSAALFDIEAYNGSIVADLFGDDRYFADVAMFWTAQNGAIETRAEAFREAGWHEVVLLPPGEPFHGWDYERCSKRKGGKVYIVTSPRGDVAFHEGYLTHKEARRLARGEGGEATDKPSRPEVNSSQQDYINLHRHAAVRSRMLGAPGLCLRVAVAHMIVGSPLWTVRTERQHAADAIVESVENSLSEAQFEAERRRLLAMLDFDPDTPTIAGGSDRLTGLFATLSTLDDTTVMAILAVVIGETFDARCDLVDGLGMQLGIDMGQVWQADDALLDGLRDREVIDAMLVELVGKDIADANAKETGKAKRQIIRDCLAGTNGRGKVEGWVPRWLHFPATSYTERGGVASVSRTVSATAAMGFVTEATDCAAETDADPVPLSQAA